ncbi:MAG: hypothetical protein PHH25_08190, partial [Bacteroidales bacterium]|nr:hypothetical protein [Bacteroidales bacterium]
SYNDPYISKITTHKKVSLNSIELTAKTLSEADVVVITTNHKDYKADFILKHASLVVDLRNAIDTKSEKLYKL